MGIHVTDLTTGKIIFKGEAEDFLFELDNDSDLEIFLSALEMKRADTDIFTDENNQSYLIEKVFEEIY